MPDEAAQKKREMREEAESFTAGPGVVVSKSQARGSVWGLAVGAILGAVVGLLVGLLAFGDSTRVVLITAVACAVAGATAGAVVGGFVEPRRKLDGTGADT